MKKTIKPFETIWSIIIIISYLYLVVANIVWPNFSLMAVTIMLTHTFCFEIQRIYKSL
jgi:hypothetical protein